MNINKKSKLIRSLFYAVIILIILAIVSYIIFKNPHYFSRRSIRQIQSYALSYGSLSPLAIVFLIFISTVIPPLPLPIPLIEIVAGVIFGFWPGFILIWISQISSSLVAFWISRFFGKHFFKRLFASRFFLTYRQYLSKKGPLAVFIIRTTMAAPFNIVSYLSGLTQMSLTGFTVATILGTIPEVALFVFIGTILKNIHISLWYLFIAIVLIGAAGLSITFLIMKFLLPDFDSKAKA